MAQPRHIIALLSASCLLALAPGVRAEGVGHELALALSGVIDEGHDRGFHYGVDYELSWSLLRVGALLSLGDTDPRRQQHWSLRLGLQPWSSFRFDVAFHHRTFTHVGFGENLVTLIGRLRWRGFELSAGYVLRFPILERARIQSPFVFDTELFEAFLTFRLGYEHRFPGGLILGLLAATHNRYELFNLDYPQFSLIVGYAHPRFGALRLEGGLGIAGFFNQGSTIDRGFLRLEYVGDFRARRRRTDAQGDSPGLAGDHQDEQETARAPR